MVHQGFVTLVTTVRLPQHVNTFTHILGYTFRSGMARASVKARKVVAVFWFPYGVACSKFWSHSKGKEQIVFSR